MANLPTEIGFCNANLPKRRFLLQGISETYDNLYTMGCDGGLETHEIIKNTRLTYEIGALAICGAFSNRRDNLPLIGSVHDSWWHLDTPLDPNPNLKQRLQRHVYWEAHVALKGMRRMQSWAGTPLIAVVYPDAQRKEVSFDASNAPFRYVSFQPTAETMHSHEIRDLQVLRRRMGRQGLTAICLDTFHYVRQGKQGQKPLPNFADVWPALLAQGLVPEIHVGFRPDQAHVDKQAALCTAYDLQAAVDGKMENTLTGDMLTIIKEHWQPRIPHEKLRVVPEIPVCALQTLRRPPKTYQDFLAVHRDINAVLRQAL